MSDQLAQLRLATLPGHGHGHVHVHVHVHVYVHIPHCNGPVCYRNLAYYDYVNAMWMGWVQ